MEPAAWCPLMTVIEKNKTGTEQVQALAGISRSALRCHSNEIRAPIVNLRNSAQLRAPTTISPTYIRVRAVVLDCGNGQTHRHIYRRRGHYTFRLRYASREM